MALRSAGGLLLRRLHVPAAFHIRDGRPGGVAILDLSDCAAHGGTSSTTGTRTVDTSAAAGSWARRVDGFGRLGDVERPDLNPHSWEPHSSAPGKEEARSLSARPPVHAFGRRGGIKGRVGHRLPWRELCIAAGALGRLLLDPGAHLNRQRWNE